MLEKLVQLIKDERSLPVLNDGASQADFDRLEKLQAVELSSSLIELYTEADGENFALVLHKISSPEASRAVYKYRETGQRQVLGCYVWLSEHEVHWREFLGLKTRHMHKHQSAIGKLDIKQWQSVRA